jgi:uncharacterized membrane protein YcaP (DUF421 family)
MFDLSMSVWELIARAAVVYIFLFTCMRLLGKKHVGDLSPFDLIVLLILSETVNGSLIGDDKSLLGGLISAATLLLIVQAMGYATWSGKKVERLFDGAPKILVRHGRVNRDVMAQEQVTHSELIEALRREGHTSLNKIRFAVLENDGSITVGTRVER